MKTYESNEYDVIVVGAGHAGCEAALASAHMGQKTLLVTIGLDMVADHLQALQRNMFIRLPVIWQSGQT